MKKKCSKCGKQHGWCNISLFDWNVQKWGLVLIQDIEK